MIIVLLAAGLLFGAIAAVWAYLRSKVYRPPGSFAAARIVCETYGIRPIRVVWMREPWTVPGVKGKVVGQWVPGAAVQVLHEPGQRFSMTALAFELAREARRQLEHFDDYSEPPNESPRLLELTEQGRAALREWEATGIEKERSDDVP